MLCVLQSCLLCISCPMTSQRHQVQQYAGKASKRTAGFAVRRCVGQAPINVSNGCCGNVDRTVCRLSVCSLFALSFLYCGFFCGCRFCCSTKLVLLCPASCYVCTCQPGTSTWTVTSGLCLTCVPLVPDPEESAAFPISKDLGIRYRRSEFACVLVCVM